jgi:hypothetical protein
MPTVDQIAADEARAAGDEDGFSHWGSPGRGKEKITTKKCRI